MKIFTIVIKNTSELDFTIPILDEYDPEKQIIFFSRLYFRSIINENHFYIKYAYKKNISIISYVDLIKNSFVKKILKFLEKIFFSNYFNSNNFFLNRLLNKLFKYIEKIIISKFCHFEILKNFDPNIIFYASRHDENFQHKIFLINFLKNPKKKIIFIPHGPHYDKPRSLDFCFSNNKFQKNFDYWLAFAKDETWRNHKNNINNFCKIGYPMFDKSWIAKINSEIKSENQYLGVITRKFYPIFKRNSSREDDWTLTYDEFMDFMNEVKKINIENPKIKFLIKPHPSTNLYDLRKILAKINLNNYKISHDPIFIFEKKIFACIAVLSTSYLYLHLLKKPVFTFKSSFSKFNLDKWPILKNIYYNDFTAENVKVLSSLFSNYLNLNKETTDLKLNKIKNVLEAFIRPNSIEKAKKRISFHINR